MSQHAPDEFDVDHPPGTRRGAHRTATPAVLEQLPWFLAVLAVVVVVVLGVVWLTGGDDPTTTPQGQTPSASSTGPAPTDPGTSAPATTGAPPVTETSAPPAETTPPPTADRSLALVVLNGTRTSGLGADVGEELEGLGWTIGEVGNAEQKPVEQTVVLYSAPEHEATAAAVAADLGVEARLDESASSEVVVLVGEDRA